MGHVLHAEVGGSQGLFSFTLEFHCPYFCAGKLFRLHPQCEEGRLFHSLFSGDMHTELSVYSSTHYEISIS